MRNSLRMAILCGLFLSVYNGVTDADSGGVAFEKKMKDLTEADARAMCDAYRKNAQEIRKGNCTLDGLAVGKNEQDCETIRDKCLEYIETYQADTEECTALKTDNFAGCTVTVGEIDRCFKSLIRYLKQLDCNQVGKRLASPPSCMQDMQKKCEN
jgi:hypothetical protein